MSNEQMRQLSLLHLKTCSYQHFLTHKINIMLFLCFACRRFLRVIYAKSVLSCVPNTINQMHRVSIKFDKCHVLLSDETLKNPGKYTIFVELRKHLPCEITKSLKNDLYVWKLIIVLIFLLFFSKQWYAKWDILVSAPDIKFSGVITL